MVAARIAVAAAAVACTFHAGTPVVAAEGDRWLFQTSVHTVHFNPDPKHVNRQNLIQVEWQRPDEKPFLGSEATLWGAAHLRNSFGQPTQYIYGGKLWRPFDSLSLLHVKLTAGLIYGYKGEFRDKIPLNRLGIAPGILPSIGLSGKRFSSEVVIFGTAGALLTFGVIWD